MLVPPPETTITPDKPKSELTGANTSTTSPQTNATYNANTNTLTLSSISDTTPFNARTKQVRSELKGGAIRDLTHSSSGVISTNMTTDNYYFQLQNESGGKGKVYYTALTHQNPIKANAKAGIGSSYYRYMPGASVIPNCVGQCRARYIELMYPNSTKSITITSSAPYWHNNSPFSLSDSHGTVDIGGGVKLYKDTSGTYGPVDGLWGRAKYSSKVPILPGCIIEWADDYHVGFVEAVFNYGKSNEYAIMSESWYANYTRNGILNIVSGPTPGRQNGYKYYHTANWVLYTPLCFLNMSAAQISGLKQVELNYAAPDMTRYNEVVEALKNQSIELKVGNKVQIEWIGNTKAAGNGKKVNKLLMHGYVRKIHASGLEYPYEVMDKPTNGALIGFFKRDSLKLL